MNLTLYHTTDDPKVVNKSLTVIKSLSGEPTEDISILSPSFIVVNELTSATFNMFDVNYLYCTELKRYYFVTIDLLAGQRLRLNCTVDPLMSFDLSRCPCTVTRSESAGITAVLDAKLPVDPNRQEVKSILLDKDPFSNSESFLLTVVGTHGTVAKP